MFLCRKKFFDAFQKFNFGWISSFRFFAQSLRIFIPKRGWLDISCIADIRRVNVTIFHPKICLFWNFCSVSYCFHWYFHAKIFRWSSCLKGLNDDRKALNFRPILVSLISDSVHPDQSSSTKRSSAPWQFLRVCRVLKIPRWPRMSQKTSFSDMESVLSAELIKKKQVSCFCLGRWSERKRFSIGFEFFHWRLKFISNLWFLKIMKAEILPIPTLFLVDEKTCSGKNFSRPKQDSEISFPQFDEARMYSGCVIFFPDFTACRHTQKN